jgi:pimeloyl-ACP methyl ester carboxylesterase
MSILDHAAISGVYFFPSPRSPRDVRMIDVDGVTIAVHSGEIDPSKLTMLHFHGNGETIADYVGADFHSFDDMGVNMVWVEYRGYGRSTGSPGLVSMLGDGERVVQALGLSFDRVIAFGRSMGSLYAIELASRQPTLAALVIESGIADPAERFLNYADLDAAGVSEAEVRAEVARHFDHQQKLASYSNPVLILHAENDHLITLSHAQRNLEWSASPNKKLVAFPHGDHNSIMPFNHEQYFEELQTLVQSIASSRAQ